MDKKAKRRNQTIKVILFLSYNLCLFPAGHGVLPVGVLQLIGVIIGKVGGVNIFLNSIASLVAICLGISLIVLRNINYKVELATILLMAVALFSYAILLGGSIVTYLSILLFIVVSILYFRKLDVKFFNKKKGM
jgi:hypothetical protein